MHESGRVRVESDSMHRHSRSSPREQSPEQRQLFKDRNNQSKYMLNVPIVFRLDKAPISSNARSLFSSCRRRYLLDATVLATELIEHPVAVQSALLIGLG